MAPISTSLRKAPEAPEFFLRGPEWLDEYRRFAEGLPTGSAQNPLWVQAWSRHCNPDIVFLGAQDAAGICIAMPLERVRELGVTSLRFPGGPHANGNFPALRPGVSLERALVDGIRQAVSAMAEAPDLIRLERLAPVMAGTPNPLLSVATTESADPALAVDLDGGFDAVLERTSAKRKRKKHRSQSRKYEAAGGFRRIASDDEAAVDRLLDAFLEMKQIRFRHAGIRNVFADPAIQGFFRDLFASATPDGRRHFVLHGLEVGGVLRAVTGSAILADRVVCEFGTIREDELSGTSPGDFLFFENIREAAEMDRALYDFSVGDEPYKRLWCNVEIRQHDAVIPTCARGQAAALLISARRQVKRIVKRNAVIWSTVKAFRRKRAVAQAPNED